MNRPPGVIHAQFCARCEKELKPGSETWLELSTKDGLYRRPGEIQQEESQGLFPFGRECVNRPNDPFEFRG